MAKEKDEKIQAPEDITDGESKEVSSIKAKEKGEKKKEDVSGKEEVKKEGQELDYLNDFDDSSDEESTKDLTGWNDKKQITEGIYGTEEGDGGYSLFLKERMGMQEQTEDRGKEKQEIKQEQLGREEKKLQTLFSISDVDKKKVVEYSIVTHELGLRILYSDKVNDEYYKLKKRLLSNERNAQFILRDEKFEDWVKISIDESLKVFLGITAEKCAKLKTTEAEILQLFAKRSKAIVEMCANNKKLLMRLLAKKTIIANRGGLKKKFLEGLLDEENVKEIIAGQFGEKSTTLKQEIKILNSKNIIEDAALCRKFGEEIKQVLCDDSGRIGKKKLTSLISVLYESSDNAKEEVDKYRNNHNRYFSSLWEQEGFKSLVIQAYLTNLIKTEESKGDKAVINVISPESAEFKEGIYLRDSEFKPFDDLLTQFIPKRLYALFIANLESQKKEIAKKGEIQRTTLPDTYIFNIENNPVIVKLLASIRLCNRSNKRFVKNREAYSYKSSTILTRVFTSFAVGHICETQEITVNFSQKDKMVSASTYKALAEQINVIKDAVRSTFEIQDADIAYWIRLVLDGHELKPLCCKRDGRTIHPETLGIYEDDIRRFVLHLAHLLFSTEVRRNPATLIHHQMILDLMMMPESVVTWDTLLKEAAIECDESREAQQSDEEELDNAQSDEEELDSAKKAATGSKAEASGSTGKATSASKVGAPGSAKKAATGSKAEASGSTEKATSTSKVGAPDSAKKVATGSKAEILDSAKKAATGSKAEASGSTEKATSASKVGAPDSAKKVATGSKAEILDSAQKAVTGSKAEIPDSAKKAATDSKAGASGSTGKATSASKTKTPGSVERAANSSKAATPDSAKKADIDSLALQLFTSIKLPMAMKGATKRIRTLHQMYTTYIVPKYKYDDGVSKASLNDPKLKELIKREYEVCDLWVKKCAPQALTFAEKVKKACDTRWYHTVK